MDSFYEEPGIKIYCGDCREILPELSGLESIITDPVWPDASVELIGSDNPFKLMHQMVQAIPSAERLVVELGCDSDPRFLAAVGERWPFLRVCWLDYARPSYKGRLLYTGDVAYIFGVPPAFIEGRQVMSGMCRSSHSDKLFIRRSHKPGSGGGRWTGRANVDKLPHPTPRRLEHVKWLVHQFSDNAVCDPFMGSGTAAVAAKYLGREFVGIEISEAYCEIAVKRLRQSVMKFEEPTPKTNQQVLL